MRTSRSDNRVDVVAIDANVVKFLEIVSKNIGERGEGFAMATYHPRIRSSLLGLEMHRVHVPTLRTLLLRSRQL